MSREEEGETLVETASADQPSARPKRRRIGLAALPVVLFVALAAVFLYRLESGTDPSQIPSVLVGRLAPATELPALEGMSMANGGAIPALSLAEGVRERPVLVNVFASWCGPCRVEHPLLMELAQDDRFDMVGINYKDQPEQARAFLRELGNPYDAIGVDQSGSATIDWGVYGVPESFLVGTDGRILYKQTGPFSVESVRNGLAPALEDALSADTDPGAASTS